MTNDMTNVTVHKPDGPNWAVNILSFCCMPILGIVLFFVWKDEKPSAAKWALGSALASVGLIILIYVFLLFIGVILG